MNELKRVTTIGERKEPIPPRVGNGVIELKNEQ